MTNKYDGFMGLCLVFVSFMQLAASAEDSNFLSLGVSAILFFFGGMFLCSGSRIVNDKKKKQVISGAAFFVIAISLIVISEGIYRQVNT